MVSAAMASGKVSVTGDEKFPADAAMARRARLQAKKRQM